MAKLLTKAAILSAALKSEEIHVPEWGGTVRITTMTGAARDEFRALLATDGKETPPIAKFYAALLVATCVDEAGNRLFDASDMAALQERSATSLDAPAEVAVRLNGLDNSAVEDAEKNSESGQSGDSGSGSPKS